MRLNDITAPAHAWLASALALEVHPRVRAQPGLARRHSAFIQSQMSAGLLGAIGLPAAALVAGATGPVTLVAWLLFLVPLLNAHFVAATGRLSAAHFLSALQLTGLVMLAAILSGGMSSFVVAWFALVPIEAALSAHRWVMIGATGASAAAFLLLAFLTYNGLLPEPAVLAVHGRELAIMATLGAIIYAGGLVSSIQQLHRTAADQIARVRDEALAASRAKTLFLATMSHELRTPLSTIIGFAEFLHRELLLSTDAGRHAEYCRIMHEQGEHLLGLVNDVLDVSKIESGTLVVDPEPFDMADLTERTVAAMRLGATARGISIVTDIDRDSPDLNADRRACRQILMNVLGNALKFSRPGNAVRVSLAAGRGHVVVRIADTGPGIAAHHLEKLGRPFYQADQGYARRHEGAGLGLSIVKGLIALHGGTFTIESTVGTGTLVTVQLPLEGSAQEVGHGPERPAASSLPLAQVSLPPTVPAATLAAVAANAFGSAGARAA